MTFTIIRTLNCSALVQTTFTHSTVFFSLFISRSLSRSILLIQFYFDLKRGSSHFPAFYICINMMCDRFRKSPTATLHNYWTFTSHMFIFLSFSCSLSLPHLSVSISFSLSFHFSLFVFRVYVCVCITSQMSVLLTNFMHARLLFFFLLFVCLCCCCWVPLLFFFSCFVPDKRTNQPVNQSAS